MTAPLVIGVGNPLRGDDGIGQAVAERLATDPRVVGATVLTCQQLTPELAQDIAAAACAVIVDADAEVQPGVVVVRRVGRGGRGPLGHHLSPSTLLTLAERLFGPCPPVFVVAIGAAAFDDEGLSPPVAAAVGAATDVVAELLDGASSADRRARGGG